MKGKKKVVQEHKLTPTMREKVWLAMRDLEKKLGYPPSIRTVAAHLLISPTDAHWHIRHLHAEKKIYREVRKPHAYTTKEQR